MLKLKQFPLAFVLFGLSVAHAQTFELELKKIDKLRGTFGDEVVGALTNLPPSLYNTAREQAMQLADRVGNDAAALADAKNKLCASLAKQGAACHVPNEEAISAISKSPAPYDGELLPFAPDADEESRVMATKVNPANPSESAVDAEPVVDVAQKPAEGSDLEASANNGGGELEAGSLQASASSAQPAQHDESLEAANTASPPHALLSRRDQTAEPEPARRVFHKAASDAEHLQADEAAPAAETQAAETVAVAPAPAKAEAEAPAQPRRRVLKDPELEPETPTAQLTTSGSRQLSSE
ncbi:MAG: hypothetical protein HY075_16555 [Deltaproteobacteria bacterium]|nr:hypothetical protein [Deltaproteobacteria bacterium]